MRRLLYLVLGALVAMALLSALLSEAMRETTLGESFASFHLLLEFPSIVVAFGIFLIRWQARHHEMGLRDWNLACGFLAAGMLDLFHSLGFSGMSDFLTPGSPEKSILFWLAARTVAALTLLAASWIPSGRVYRPKERRLLLAGGAVVPFVFLGLITYAPGIFPEVYEPGVGLTSAKIAAEIVIIAMMAWAALRFWQEFRETGERWEALLTLALVISIFSEIAFTQYRNVTDVFIIQGHLLKNVAYILVFLAIFVTSVDSPYLNLLKTQLTLREAMARIEADRQAALLAKNRTELYLDFMSHDIANFITPIGPYAELIHAQQGMPPVVQSGATAILTQSRRATRFIQLLRRLTEAELMEPEDFVQLDLARLLKGAAERAEANVQGKRLQVGFDLPATPCEIRGGEQLADVFVQLMENAARFDAGPTVRLDVLVRPCVYKGGPGWQVSVADQGPGIPPERRAFVLQGLEPDEPRERRGISSTLPILARLVGHFGGKLEIADRVAGEPDRGTVVRTYFAATETAEAVPPEPSRTPLHRVLARVAKGSPGARQRAAEPAEGRSATSSGGDGSPRK